MIVGRAARPCVPLTYLDASRPTTVMHVAHAGTVLRASASPGRRTGALRVVRVDEELDRVVARLAVDIDGAGVVRRAGVVEPDSSR